MDTFHELSEVIKLCERELALDQDPEINYIAEQCYIVRKHLLTRVRKLDSLSFTSKTKMMLAQHLIQEDIEKSRSRIRELSHSVQREVGYRHRLEMRQASDRLVEIQVEQRKILNAVEDQKRVLQGLQEERSIMNLVQEQQKIIQIVQDIQQQMQRSKFPG